MTDSEQPSNSRRDFLTGKTIRRQLEASGETLADAILESDRIPPAAASALRLATDAMACTFAILLNPEDRDRLGIISDALDEVHPLEDQMTVYRSTSEVSRINQTAFEHEMPVESRLFSLFQLALRIAADTEGAFDPTAGDLLRLWRSCKRESRIPTQSEIDDVLQRVGHHQIQLNTETETVRFLKDGVKLDLGGIGKGWALDRIGERLSSEDVENWLLHGGHSSLLAHGDHNETGGWPVGIRNPLFPEENLATILLKNQALSSSGAGTQFFRYQGKRYGHVLDPRSGWPVDDVLSVTVIAPTAAEADALSTAFFVNGLENAREYCDNRKEIGVLIIPPPRSGRTLEPIAFNLPDDVLFRSSE